MYKLPIITPGEILLEEFLKPLHLSAYKLAKATGIQQTRISEIIKNKRRITIDTALRLSAFFGNTAQFWINSQNWYDLEVRERALKKELGMIKKNPIGFKKIKQKSAR